MSPGPIRFCNMHRAPDSHISAESRMLFDDVAWKRNGDIFSTWKNEVFDEKTTTEIARCIARHTGRSAGELFPPKGGAFNMVFRMEFPDAESAAFRIPKPGFCVFPEEKVKKEVAVMRFIKRHTNIPIPRIVHCGTTEESPGQLGPFIIMEYIKSDTSLADALRSPNLHDKRPILDPDLPEDRLGSAYSGMAKILIELANSSFNEIGSISYDEGYEPLDKNLVTDPPLTMNMNRLVQLGNFPPELLPQQTFKSASGYFLALADMHMTHLYMQPNKAIISAQDCRQKYIARCLFRKLARENRLCRYDNGPFKLFCDDLRPANVLTNSNDGLSIVGAIDWEFSYAAPAEFVYSPPTWLILERPESWSKGLDDWIKTYEKYLPVFLQELFKQEEIAINNGILAEENRICQKMKQSWETGDFWVNYAARRSWAFDLVYWALIDRRFFGEGDLKDRYDLLTTAEKEEMEGFVQRKLSQDQKIETVGRKSN